MDEHNDYETYDELDTGADEKFQLRQDNLQLRQENSQVKQELYNTERSLEKCERELQVVRKQFLLLCGAVAILVVVIVALNVFVVYRNNKPAVNVSGTGIHTTAAQTTQDDPWAQYTLADDETEEARLPGTGAQDGTVAVTEEPGTSERETTTAATTTTTQATTTTRQISTKPNVTVTFVNASGREVPVKVYDDFPGSGEAAARIGSADIKIKLTGPDASRAKIKLRYSNGTWGSEEKKPDTTYKLDGPLVFAIYLDQADESSIVYVKAAP